MKKFTLIAACLMAIVLQAQTVAFQSAPIKRGTGYFGGRVIGKIGDKIYLNTSDFNFIGAVNEKTYHTVDAKTLKLVNSKSIKDDRGDHFMDGNSYNIINNQLFAVSYVVADKKAKVQACPYNVEKYNTSTFEVESETELFTFERTKVRPYETPPEHYADNVSPNGQYYVYAVTNYTTGKYALAVLDNKLTKLWSAEGLQVSGDNSNDIDVRVNNKGEVALLLSGYNWKLKKTANYCLTFDGKGSALSTIDVKLPGKETGKAKLATNGDDFFVVGRVIEKEKGSVTAYYTKLKPSLDGIETPVYETVTGEKETSIDTYDIREVFTNKTGVVIVMEKHGTQEMTTSSRSYTYQTYYSNLVFNMSATGNKVTKVYKSLEPFHYTTVGGPLYIYQNDKVYIVYNDNAENFDIRDEKSMSKVYNNTELVIAICDINAGTYTKERLAKPKSAELFYINYPTSVTEGNDVYFMSMPNQYDGYGGMGKLTLK